MFPEEFETLTIDHCNKFRQNLRLMFFDIQDICFSYRDDKDKDLSQWISFTNDIDSHTKSLLFIEKFANRREPIENFKPKSENIYNFINSNCDDFLKEILVPLYEILDKTNDSGLILSNLNIRDDIKKWDEIEKNIRRVQDKIDKSLYSRAINCSIRGKAIVHLFLVIKELNSVYSSIPNNMTEEERKLFVLQREVESLRRQVKVKDTQIRQLQTEKSKLQSKLDAEIKAHKDDIRKAYVEFTRKEDEFKQNYNILNDRNKEIEQNAHNLKDQNEKMKEQNEKIQAKTLQDDQLFQQILSIANSAFL
ncbi:hypothetical protein TRFO_42415 [Tritrichomonas foetus]|uniref:Uncharacterized protein n=1 Tax=Tritrichomonas foetus TaxID=1144522 RepID=A0A1J4KWP3_9EUKA|nr:hypothetical protein TRFO_42415 [Tritrichomonas foetus]|eukprot:OHT15655.1 hypothetical protein TRFO_42415 [Tritrichomonas foetus]